MTIHRYHYTIDEHGNWFCEGNAIVDRELFRVLSRSLYEEEGRYFLRCEGEVHPVEVADAPLWVQYVHVERDACGEGLARVDIELQDGRREPLAADTLTVGAHNALYCLATGRRLKARFGRVAYYELTRYLQMDPEERFFFVIGRHRYGIEPEPRAGAPSTDA